MELSIFNTQGEDTGKKAQLNDAIFAIDPNDHAIYLDVKQHMANKRQGTHQSKERSAITGSNRKIKKQKGTGTARAGSIKSPLFRGGGRAFGPSPRDYHFKLNKKLKRLARISALTYKAKKNQILVVENFDFETPSTKKVLAITNSLKINDKKALIVLSSQNKNVYLSSRNLENTKTVNASELSTYDLMNATAVLFFEDAINVVNDI